MGQSKQQLNMTVLKLYIIASNLFFFFKVNLLHFVYLLVKLVCLFIEEDFILCRKKVSGRAVEVVSSFHSLSSTELVHILRHNTESQGTPCGIIISW